MVHTYSKIKTDGKYNEDFKTYMTLGILQYLPSNLFWDLIRNSVTDPTTLPILSGDLISIDFWPKWYNLENIPYVKNTHYIEPDVFITFNEFDCIIEIKKSDSVGQYEAQWKSQIAAYYNQYGKDKKLIYIALGGNSNLDSSKDLDFVFKATWHRLLSCINKAVLERNAIKFHTQQTTQELRILNAVIDIFSNYNEYIVELLNTLKFEKIQLASLNELNEIWKI